MQHVCRSTHWATAAFALLALSCPRRQPPEGAAPAVALGKLDVRDATGPSARVATREELRAHIEKHLKKSRQFVENKGADRTVYDLRVELGVRVAEPGAVALVSVDGTPRRGAVRLHATVVDRFGSADASRAQQRAHLLAAVDRALSEIAFQAEVSVAPPARVAELLRRERDPPRLAAAVEIAAMRRVRAAVPALIALLGDERTEVSDRAIGALVEIGDRRAVKPLTRLAKPRDTARLAKVVDAIGTLGGPEAISYLEFVAVGHEDADIRNLAREALERIRRAQPEEPTSRHE